MQKLVRRSAYASKYSARKTAKQEAYNERLYQRKDILERVTVNNDVRELAKKHKKARWDSIYRGQIAPRHDFGAKADEHGTIAQGRLNGPRVLKKRRVTCPFVAGDRVVLVGNKYRDRGKIGKILGIDEDSQCLRIEGIEVANFYKPPFLRQMTQSPAPYHASPSPIPYEDVRLVYPLAHPDTGILRDVVINEIELREPSWVEKRAGIEKPVRSIAGLIPVVELPYAESKEAEYEDTDSDTLRIEVEERTWVPTLGIPPMPTNVVDELRNKYSIYRTRFDDAFIAKKEAAAQRVANKERDLKLAAKTPFDEINLANRKQLQETAAEAGKDGAWAPLSSEVIERIAQMGLKNAEITGRTLPAHTKEQFELITNGFVDDVVPDDVPEEALADDTDEWVDLDAAAEAPTEPSKDKTHP